MWATETQLHLKTKWKLLKQLWKQPINAPEDRGAGNIPVDKLVNINCGEVILKNFKSHEQTGQHMCTGQQHKVTTKGLQIFKKKKTLQKAPRKYLRTWAINHKEKKHRKVTEENTKKLQTEEDALNTKHSKSSKPMSTCKGTRRPHKLKQ